jgi:hypothetical protein
MLLAQEALLSTHVVHCWIVQPYQRHAQPNNRLEPTASSFGFAYASGGGSGAALGTKHTTTQDEGKTHTMRHVVLSHTVSPRTSPGPRNTVPQDTGCAEEHRWYSSPLLVPQGHSVF